jgi:hypothetical protein
MPDDKNPAEKVIGTFGGLTATALAIGVGVTTVQGWRVRKRVPQEHWVKIQEAAKAVGQDISLTDLLGAAA